MAKGKVTKTSSYTAQVKEKNKEIRKNKHETLMLNHQIGKRRRLTARLKQSGVIVTGTESIKRMRKMLYPFTKHFPITVKKGLEELANTKTIG